MTSLFLSAGDLGSDTVQILLAILGDTATTDAERESECEIIVNHVSFLPHVPVGVGFQHLNLLQRLHDLTGNRARGNGVFVGTVSTVLTTTVVLLQGTNTNTIAEVDVTSNGSYSSTSNLGHSVRHLNFTTSYDLHTSTHVEPVRVVGSEFLVRSGLDEVDPLGDFQLSGTLEVGSVCLDESVCANVLYSDTSAGHDFRECWLEMLP